MKMKQIVFLLFFAAAAFHAAAELTVELEPVRPTVRRNEYIQLLLKSGSGITSFDYPEVEGARWMKNFQQKQVQNVNGKVTHFQVLYLAPEKTGTITVPPFKVRAGRESASTPAVKIRVLEPSAPEQGEEGKSVKLSDVVGGSISIEPDRKYFYVGEELTLHCDLLVDERFARQIRVTYYPELTDVADALFTTWETRNGKVRFQTSPPRQVTEKEAVFLRYRFTARCRLVKPGVFSPGGAVSVGVAQSRSSRSGDPFDDPFGGGFFDSFFASSRVEPYTVEFKKAPAVTIKALPAPPPGVLDTRLVGQWRIAGSISSASLRQGEAAEISLLFTGTGASESFSAPRLQIPGFRVYPPEVVKKEGSVSVKYALVPLVPGEKQIRFTLGTFDPAAEKWQTGEIAFRTAVVKSALPAPPVPREESGNTGVPAAATASGPSGSPSGETPLLYQKNAPGPVVKLPLIDNSFWWIILFLAGCPLVAVCFELYFRKEEREAASPELLRRKSRKKEMGRLLKELDSRGDTHDFRSRMIPLVGEALGLSAGATPGEIAGRVETPEVRRYFADLDSAGFLPGADKGPLLDARSKKALVKFLKRVMLLAVLFFGGSAVGGELNAAFNKGDYRKAAEEYRSLIKAPGGLRPDMLYNYGNCQYYLGNLPEARYALNLASLLHPRDHEIRANLNLVNAKLFQNGGGSSFSAMLESMRDQLRCDQYILLAAFFWGALWILWSWRRRLSGNFRFSCGGVLAVLMVLCIVCAGTQLGSICSPAKVMTVVKSVELRTLPGVNSGHVETTLAGGGEGELIQSDPSGFARVRINGREGWVAASSLKPALPGGVF